MTTDPIIELLGDGISSELSTSVHQIADTLPFQIDFQPIDLSDASRRRDSGTLFDRTEKAMRDVGVTIKYPTSTTEFTDEICERLKRG